VTPIIAVANHKGGAGKTTTAYYLALHLAKTMRVLAVDLDDQAGLTSRMTTERTFERTVADVLLREATVAEAIYPACDSPGWPSLVPADTRLSWAAAKLQAMSPNHLFLARALAAASDYDVILLDCPPSADIVIVNAMMAATHLVMAATPTVESFEGTLRMRAMIGDLADMTGRQPEILGIVATQVVGNSKSHQRYLAEMRTEAMLGDYGLLGCVPMRVGVDASQQLFDAYADVAQRIRTEVEATC
jgi:chromosome partitioning protein